MKIEKEAFPEEVQENSSNIPPSPPPDENKEDFGFPIPPTLPPSKKRGRGEEEIPETIMKKVRWIDLSKEKEKIISDKHLKAIEKVHITKKLKKIQAEFAKQEQKKAESKPVTDLDKHLTTVLKNVPSEVTHQLIQSTIEEKEKQLAKLEEEIRLPPPIIIPENYPRSGGEKVTSKFHEMATKNEEEKPKTIEEQVHEDYVRFKNNEEKFENLESRFIASQKEEERLAMRAEIDRLNAHRNLMAQQQPHSKAAEVPGNLTGELKSLTSNVLKNLSFSSVVNWITSNIGNISNMEKNKTHQTFQEKPVEERKEEIVRSAVRYEKKQNPIVQPEEITQTQPEPLAEQFSREEEEEETAFTSQNYEQRLMESHQIAEQIKADRLREQHDEDEDFSELLPAANRSRQNVYVKQPEPRPQPNYSSRKPQQKAERRYSQQEIQESHEWFANYKTQKNNEEREYQMRRQKIEEDRNQRLQYEKFSASGYREREKESSSLNPLPKSSLPIDEGVKKDVTPERTGPSISERKIQADMRNSQILFRGKNPAFHIKKEIGTMEHILNENRNAAELLNENNLVFAHTGQHKKRNH